MDILGKISEKTIPREKRGIVSIIHICLVSGQALPNPIPLLDPDFKVDQAVLVVSNEAMRKKAGALERVLKNHGRTVFVETLGSDSDFVAMSSRFKTLAAKYPRALLNASGGKKTMTLAAYEKFNREGHDIFYVERDNSVQWLRGNGPVALSDCLEFDDISSAHGFAVRSRKPEPTALYRKLAEQLFLKRHEGMVKVINFLNFRGKGKTDKKVSWATDELPSENEKSNLDHLMKWLSNSSLSSRDQTEGGWKVKAEAINFIKGEWLEVLVHDQVRSLSQHHRIGNICYGATFSGVNGLGNDEGVNEFDVAFVSRNQLFLVECKVVKQNALKDINPFIYKLDSIKTRFGGLTVHAALALVGGQVTEALLKKADRSGIRIITGEDLGRLNAALEDWVKEKKP